jgi:uncharacterized protein YqgC (DUF456 family)
MTNALPILEATGTGLGFAAMAVLCLVGLILSCLSISGTWCVVAATALAIPLSRDPFPGWWTVAGMVAVAALVEVAETAAGAWGVQKRGGSALSGLAALVGGLAGMILCAPVVPPFGSLLGMLAGSFGLAYFTEYQRIKKREHAAHVAMGAVLARLMMLFAKVVVTLGLIAWLVAGLVLD